jgi:UDP-glucose 4-epimerase
VARLLRDGHEVVVLDDLSSGRRELVPRGARLVVGGVEHEADLDAAFEAAPDLVVHLAALFANQNSVERPARDLLVNGMGTLNVLERSTRAAVAKVLVCSSSCVYNRADPADEADEVGSQETPYAITKGLSEDYARFWAHHHGLDVVIIRPFNVYGPHEHPGRYRNVIPNFMAMAMQGAPLPITGSGQETRDFTYVADVVEGMVAALRLPTAPGAVYNLGTGRETRILDLAEQINELTGNHAGVILHEMRTWDHTTRRRASIERARADLGYGPVVTLRDGLERTYQWLRSLDA